MVVEAGKDDCGEGDDLWPSINKDNQLVWSYLASRPLLSGPNYACGLRASAAHALNMLFNLSRPPLPTRQSPSVSL